MQCRSHPTKTATTTCNQCASQICDDCTVDLQGRVFCHPCIAIFAQTSDAPPPYTASGRISKGALIFFSLFFPPGANYMYMGLIKRGLAVMCAFFLAIFLVINVSWPLMLLFIFALPVIYFSSLMDGLNICRRINAGEPVRDDIGETLNSVLRNRTLRTVLLVIIAVALLTQVVGILASVFISIIPVLIVGFIIYLIARRRA